ncbi:type IV secretory system conjugative DNA transfer family protein [Glaciibacter psychrotolerans]|uniref:Energy-coupling factor transporter ATP-binding protein EcfA2 n=1 Tax=Glaciibacter psychrotolerans TaxID=670054 RepID=A0A7Z0J4W9_9MICO|nr:type IV secretory system conjugative DNA transfer family protein [Leifsonia psychrotolerans]NYJ18278.1 energy-coupling factor transporter ATP-binding protein EcfA2 [Leifsonia psychrotolerans]
MREPFVFTRLYLQRPIEAGTVTQLLTRLMGSDVPRPLVLEVNANADGVAHLLGCAPTAMQAVKRLLSGGIPGIGYGAAARLDVATVGRVSAAPGGLPLAEVDPEQVVASLYGALASRRGSENVAVQLVLGRAHHPSHVSKQTPDPLQPLHSRLLDGTRPAPADVHRRLSNRASQTRLDTTVRIGVTAETHKRRMTLTWRVFGSLQLLESPGVRLTLTREAPTKWRQGTPSRSSLRLSAGELTPLLSLPLGERDYPGVPGLHPRLLPVPEIVSSSASVFATGTAPGPGPGRSIGIDPTSRLQHVVTTGPTGSGKSTLLEHLILSDIAAHRACVVIEPKRQLIDSTLDRVPIEAAERIVVIDAADERPVGFNPLDVGDRDPDIVVDGILAALAAVFEDGWGPRTEYLIQGALLSLARAGQNRPDPFTLIDLPRLLTDAAFRRPVISAVSDDPTLATFWAEFEEMRPGQRAAAIAAPLNKLRKLVLRKQLVAVLGQPRPRFRLRDVFRERNTVLVPLNDALIGTGAAKLLGSLIVAELWMATLERASEKEPTKRPGMVFIDEVQNYLHLPTSIADALATSRSYGVAWHLAHQYRGQLPVAMRAAFDTNARTKLCFALGPDDARDMARMAPVLSPEDFQALPPYEIYAHLIASGIPAGWCSAASLPPAPAVGASQQIRDASRDRYGALPLEPHVTPETPTTNQSEKSAPARSSHQKPRRS